ncbi:hypothetical protein [Mucilaginibacter phyllosphaerae]
METKQLALQSFERNQGLLDNINKFLIHLRLSQKGIDDKMDDEEVDGAKAQITSFFGKLNSLVDTAGENASPLTGVDVRYRSLVRKYVDAKGHRNKFKSILFKNSPDKVMQLMDSTEKSDVNKLIESLSEFKSLLEDHGVVDARELIGDI